MTIGLRLLKLTAKIALDRLLGSRTDEALTLLQNWWSGDDVSSREREIAGAKDVASDPGLLDRLVAETVAAAGKTIDPSQIEALTLSLSSGFKSLPDDLGADPSGPSTIAEKVLPGRAKTFVVWLDHPAFDGPRRYVHFNWDGEAWRVRDFVAGKVYHPQGSKATDKGLMAVQAAVTALEVWKASRGQVQSLKQYGLGFGVSDQADQDKWRQLLTLLSCAVNQITVEPVGPSVLSPEEWRRRILETAGKWQGKFERPEQGEYEQREPLS